MAFDTASARRPQPSDEGRRRSFFMRGLALLAAAVALPLLALQAYTLYRQAERDREEAIATVVARSEDAARELDLALARAERILSFLATRRELQEPDPARCSELVKGMTTIDPLLANVGAVDLDGNPLCLSVVSATRLRSYKDVGWFQEALKRDDTFLSKPFLGDVSRRPIANLVMPLRGPDGRRIGFLGAAIDLRAVSQQLLSVAGLPPNSNVTLIDADSVVVARNPDLPGVIGSAAPTDTSTNEPRATRRSFIGKGSDGVLRVYARTRLAHFGMSVGAGVALDGIVAKGRAVLWRSALAVAGATALGLFAALWAMRRLTTPLRSLTGSARALAAGDREARADESLPEEFGALATELNRMLDAQQAMHTMRQSQAAAEAANQAKSRFLAHISHEIRTPMNAVLGLTRLLAHTPLNKEQAEFVGKTRIAAESLLELVDKVLDVSKIEAGKLELEALAFRTDDVVQTVRALIEQRARARGLAFRVVIAPELPGWLIGDSQRLAQVLVNLCGNAVKFTERGEVTLEIGLARALDAPPGGVMLRVVVADTGLGMTAEQLGRLFEPFVQADASTNRRFGGTGLGLAICKQLVELMGGTISVSSTPGRGTRFTFTAAFGRADVVEPSGSAAVAPAAAPAAGPAAPSAAPPAAPPAATPAAPSPEVPGVLPLSGLTLLLVEDNEVNQLVAAELLRRTGGARVEVCDDGPSALALLARQPVDAVLMDVQMPGMDGFEVTRRIRRQLHLVALPVIAMTAHATAQDRADCLAAGMNDYMTKPFDPARLIALIARLTGRGGADRAA